MEAEAYSNAPGLLRRGLSELLQHLLATFTTILQEQLPGELLVPPKRPQLSRKHLQGASAYAGHLPHHSAGRQMGQMGAHTFARCLLSWRVTYWTGHSHHGAHSRVLSELPPNKGKVHSWLGSIVSATGTKPADRAGGLRPRRHRRDPRAAAAGRPKAPGVDFAGTCSVQIKFSLVLITKGTERASCAETNLGGTLQLLVDLKFLAGAFSPLVKAPHEASISACRQSIVDQAVALAKGQGEREDPLAERLEEWLSSCEVSCRLA